MISLLKRIIGQKRRIFAVAARVRASWKQRKTPARNYPPRKSTAGSSAQAGQFLVTSSQFVFTVFPARFHGIQTAVEFRLPRRVFGPVQMSYQRSQFETLCPPLNPRCQP